MSTRKEAYTQEKCETVTTFVSTEEGAKDVSVAEKYYDLVTDFFEIGWGRCFHYAPQAKGENYHEAILKHELNLAKALGLKPGMKVLDAGCGVGGPMINIAKATGCSIDGITICEYQIGKGRKYVEEEGLSDRCKFIHEDFMGTKFPDNSYDAIFAIETTCHAPDKTVCFTEMNRILKPGALFGGYEWCITDKYDKNNPEHREIIDLIEHGAQVQKLATFEEVQQSLKNAGFEVLDARDVCTEGRSWGSILQKRWRHKKPVRKLTDFILSISEKLGRVPKGSTQVALYLGTCIEPFIKAEKLGIFTPMYHFLARKPLK